MATLLELDRPAHVMVEQGGPVVARCDRSQMAGRRIVRLRVLSLVAVNEKLVLIRESGGTYFEFIGNWSGANCLSA